MIYILYSNDYEVFLGGNYRPEREVLINSTESVLAACAEINVPITLFCDMTCLWRYREQGYNEFPEAVEEQLKDTIQKGHDVQTHIHPHWFDTEISATGSGTSTYKVDPGKFLIGNWIPADGSSLREFCTGVFIRAKHHLEELLQPYDPKYQCMSYRAGGYGVQPNSEDIYGALLDAGYLVDSSIVPGMIYESNVNKIDFSCAPDSGNYLLSAKDDILSATDEGVFEIPVLALKDGSARWLLLKAFIRKVFKALFNPPHRNHMGYPIQMSDSISKKKGSLKQILDEVQIIKRGWYMLELGEDEDLMVDATRQYINRHQESDKDLFVSVSCHSKSTNSLMLKAFRKYHRRLETIYGSQLKAITFQEAGRLINSKER